MTYTSITNADAFLSQKLHYRIEFDFAFQKTQFIREVLQLECENKEFAICPHDLEICFLPSDKTSFFSGLTETVENEISLSISNRSEKDYIDSIVTILGITQLLSRKLESLSGGERTKVALCCLLVHKPDFLLLDQSFDDISVSDLRSIEKSLEIFILNCGGLLDCFCKGRHRLKKIGRNAKELYYPYSAVSLQKLQQIKDLFESDSTKNLMSFEKTNIEKFIFKLKSFSYGKSTLLKDIRININKGDCIGIYGKNGSGKSTLLKLMSGIIETETQNVTKDFVSCDGSVTQYNNIHSYISYNFQNPSDQFYCQSSKDELKETAKNFGLDKTHQLTVLNKLVKSSDELMLSTQQRFRFFPWISIDDLELSPFELDVSKQRTISVLSSLLFCPPLILFDEPSSQVDSLQEYFIKVVIKNYINAGGMGVIISHQDSFLKETCTQIFELHNGELHER